MLSGPQRKFCEGIAKGMPAMVAYALAYPKCKPHSAEANTTRLMKNDEVKAEIEALRKRADEMPGGAVFTLRQKREILFKIGNAKPSEAGPDNPLAVLAMSKAGPYYTFPDKLQAIKIDNDLSGDGAEAEGNKALGGMAALLARLRK